MGPCPFRHGNEYERAAAVLPGLLQWGHVLSDMVTCSASRCRSTARMLQWGHVLSDMVTGPGIVAPNPAPSRFNGAMSFQTW